jgi:glucose-6-phosphate 1-dehydrogenase
MGGKMKIIKQLKDFTNQLAYISEVVWEDESIEQLVSVLKNYETLNNTLIYCATILNF